MYGVPHPSGTNLTRLIEVLLSLLQLDPIQIASDARILRKPCVGRAASFEKESGRSSRINSRLPFSWGELPSELIRRHDKV